MESEKSFSYEATDSMRSSISIGEEIAACDRLINSVEVPEDVKEEMKLKKDMLLKQKVGSDSYILNDINRKR